MHVEIRRLWPRRPKDGNLPLGLSCDGEGLLLAGNCRLISAALTVKGQKSYRVRPLAEVNAILAAGYGGPVDAGDAYPKLQRVAEKMSQGEWTRAALGALDLRLPDLSDQAAARRVLAADWLLKAFWDPRLHPRWPAHSEEGHGGEFSPSDDGGGDNLLLPISALDDRYARDRLGRSLIVQIDPFLKPGQPPAAAGFPIGVPAEVGAQIAAIAESHGMRAAAEMLIEVAPHVLNELPTL